MILSDYPNGNSENSENSAKEKGTANAISLSEVCAYIHRNGGLTQTNVEPVYNIITRLKTF